MMDDTIDILTPQAYEEEPLPSRPVYRGAIGFLSDSILHQLIDVPEGVEIRGIYPDNLRRGWVIHFSGDALPAVDEGTEPPHATAHVRYVTFTRDQWKAGDVAKTYFARCTFTMPKEGGE